MGSPARIEHFRKRHSDYPLRCKQSYRAAAWSALATARMWLARGEDRWVRHWLGRARRAHALSIAAAPGNRFRDVCPGAFDPNAPTLSARQLGVGRYA